MSKVLLHCPQCGHDSHGPAQRAVECPKCEALLVHLGGETKTAREFEGGAFPADHQTIALACRLCGAAWPMSVADKPSGGKCTYCGHPAVLPPGLLELLKLTFTRPQAVPGALRSFQIQWAAVLGCFLALIALYWFLPSPELSAEATLPISGAVFQENTPEGKRYTMEVRSPTVEVQALGNNFLNAMLKAFEIDSTGNEVVSRVLIPNTELRLRVAAVQEATGAEREAWIKMWHRTPPDVESAKKDEVYSHPYASVPLGKSYEVAHWPPGRYHLVIKEAVALGGPLPERLHVEWNSGEVNRNGSFILLINVLMWLNVFDLRRVNKHRFRAGTVSWLAVAAFVCCAVLLVDLIHPLEFLHRMGEFPGD